VLLLHTVVLLYCCRWGAETFAHLMELVHLPEAVQAAGTDTLYCFFTLLLYCCTAAGGVQRPSPT
jgi:hypothetical protein